MIAGKSFKIETFQNGRKIYHLLYNGIEIGYTYSLDEAKDWLKSFLLTEEEQKIYNSKIDQPKKTNHI
jgi:predicted DNA-binding ArsR family transcriptional regulator